MLYRYFIFYSVQMSNGNIAYKHIFLDLNKKIIDDVVLNDVEQFLLKQNPDFKNLLINNFSLVSTSKKPKGDKNG